MTGRNETEAKKNVKEVKKPFLKGDITDENTAKKSLSFFGTLLVVFFVAFLAGATASFNNFFLRLLMNLALIAVALMLFFNNGSRHGAEAVARGEILYQKKERGRIFSDSERKICFHPGKGYLNGLIGSWSFGRRATSSGWLTANAENLRLRRKNGAST